MKKLLAVVLTLVMVLGVVPVGALALNEEDYDNQDIFSIKEDTSVLSPGVDYYFDCEWQGGPITDDFFEFYDVSVSVSRASDDNVSSTTAKRIVEKAEFIKLGSEDKYYFHFRALANYSYADDAEVLITVLAKDKSRDSKKLDSRSWYQMELEIGYHDKEAVEEVSTSQYDVDASSPIVEFDEDLTSCRLDFEDGSYYNLRLAKSRKFNLGHTTTPNSAIVKAYPNAKLKFLTFYARPSFAYESVLKIYAPGTKYLYEIGDGNSLKLISDVNINDYFGYTTSRLGAYVASSVPLEAATVATGTGTTHDNGTTQPPTAAQSNTGTVISNPQTGALI